MGGQGQHLSGAHLDHRRSRAPGLVAVGVQAEDGFRQEVLHLGLEVQVDGQFHDVAGDGLRGVVFPGDFPLVVGGHHPAAVLALEVFLEGQFRALLAN